METETEKIIGNQFKYLPEEIIALFANPNTNVKILEIGKKYNLNYEQLEILQTETSLLILNLTHPDDYKSELKARLNIQEENLNNTVKEIYSFISDEIIQKLKDIYNDEEINQVELDPNFSNLQNNVQEAIANSNWKEKLYDLANKYKLTIPQMGILEETTAKVMKNEIHPDKYEDELASKLTLSKDDLSNLVKDINDNILITIRELLKGGSNNIEEEIPLPPYRVITNDKLPINNMEEIKPIEIPKQPETVINNITMDSTPVNMLEEKLKGATISDHNVSDYSTPKINVLSTPAENKEAPLPRSFDPYREAF